MLAYNLLTLLLPISLITGPFIPDLSVCILGFFIIYSLISKKTLRESIISNELLKNFLILIFLFNIYLITRSLLAYDPYFSLQSSLFYFRFIPFLIFLTLFFFSNDRNLKNFSYLVILCCLILFLDVLIEVFFSKRVFGEISPFGHIGRFSSFFGDELILGSYVAYLTPFIIIFFLFLNQNPNIKKTIITFLLILTFFILIIFSGERVSLFQYTCFILVYYFILEKISVKRFLIFILLIISMTLILENNDSKSIKRIFYETKSQIIDENNEIRIFSLHHESHILTSIDMFNDNKIFGVGSKMFRKLCSDEKYAYYIDYSKSRVSKEKEPHFVNGCSTHTHHYFIQILSENGILGFLFLAFIYLYCIYSSFKIILSREMKSNIWLKINLIGFLSIIIFFNPLTPSRDFFNNWLSVLIYISASLIFLRGKNAK